MATKFETKLAITQLVCICIIDKIDQLEENEVTDPHVHGCSVSMYVHFCQN